MSVHGAWQIAETGLCSSKNDRMKLTASAFVRRKSGLATPPGSTSPSYSDVLGLRHRLVHGERVGLVQMIESLDLAGLNRDKLNLGPRVLHGFPRLR